MKSVKFLSVVALAALICSCGGNKELQFSKSQVTVTYGQSTDVSLIGETEAATWTSAKPFVATVLGESGVATSIKGAHVGETVLEAKTSKLTGNVTVKVIPSINALSRPIDVTIFNKTKDQVIAEFGDPDTIATDKRWMRYVESTGFPQYVYLFDENNNITCVDVYVTVANQTALQNYLAYLSQYGETVVADNTSMKYLLVDAEIPEGASSWNDINADNLFILQMLDTDPVATGYVFAIEYRPYDLKSEEQAAAPAKVVGLKR